MTHPQQIIPTDGEVEERLPFGRKLGGRWVLAVQSRALTLTDNCCSEGLLGWWSFVVCKYQNENRTD